MGETSKILIVDDDDSHAALLAEMVGEMGHESEHVDDGFGALAELKLDYDMVLLDAKMPGMDGYEVTRRIRKKENDEHLPVVIVTSLDSAADRRRAREAGADDFIGKPVQEAELQTRISSMLAWKEREKELENERDRLKKKMEKQSSELRQTVEELTDSYRTAHEAEMETLQRLAVAAEYRDEDTGAHVQRVGRYCSLVGERLNLTPSRVEVLQHAAPLHDLGKIGIPDSILLKPGDLSDEEWSIMQDHTTIAGTILNESSSRYLKAGKEIALSHHEKWNGSGYPNGVAGEDIPLSGRICAVADVFDALTSDRPYRDALSIEKATGIMKEGRGEHFDPNLLDLFFEDFDEVLAIREKHSDDSG